MDAYVKNKDTNAITKTTQSLVSDYLNTGDWELSSASEYEQQQNIEFVEDVQEEQQESETQESETVAQEQPDNKRKPKK